MSCSYSSEPEIKRSSYQIYHEYLQGGLSYLDLENERDSDLATQIRQHFARFIYKFINQIPRAYPFGDCQCHIVSIKSRCHARDIDSATNPLQFIRTVSQMEWKFEYYDRVRSGKVCCPNFCRRLNVLLCLVVRETNESNPSHAANWNYLLFEHVQQHCVVERSKMNGFRKLLHLGLINSWLHMR